MSGASNAQMREELEHWIRELHRVSPGSIGDILRFGVVDCDAAAGEYTFDVETADWMRNAFGVLHGGLSATIMDQGMGMLAACLTDGKGITPSIQLNVAYHRPLTPGKEIRLRIHVDSMTRTLIHMSAQIALTDAPERLCVSGSGIYYFKPFDA